jgi:hypothetical protein
MVGGPDEIDLCGRQRFINFQFSTFQEIICTGDFSYLISGILRYKKILILDVIS